MTAPDSFVAVSPPPGQDGPWAVTVNDAATGDVEHVVMPAVARHMGVDTTAVDRRCRIWLTFSHGPRCAGDTAGCGIPGTCASAVVRIVPKTGAAKAVLIGSGNELVEDAQPSPGGELLAYVVATCTRTPGKYLVVDDLATGRSWTIGRALAPCHSFGSLSWSPDGKDLALAYGRSALRTVGGSRMCGTPLPKELAVVPAMRPAPRLPGRRVHMDPNCQANAVAATRTGFAVLEACGRKYGYRTGPAPLVFFDLMLHETSRSSVGHCLGTSGELRADPSRSDLLGSTQQSCNPMTIPLPKLAPARYTVLFTDNGSGVHTVIDRRQGGPSWGTFSHVSW
ncbi:MAG: hypothetical protein ACRDYZ_08205 [Acidimicrobiales bacterium]